MHQQMGNAVTAFIAGAVPAVATWMPFDDSIAKSAPDAVKLADASQFADASIFNGWSASNELYASDKELLKRLHPGLAAGQRSAGDQAARRCWPSCRPSKLKEFTLPQLQAQYDAVRWHSAEDWGKLYRDGSVTRSSNEVTAFNVAVGAFADPLPGRNLLRSEPAPGCAGARLSQSRGEPTCRSWSAKREPGSEAEHAAHRAFGAGIGSRDFRRRPYSTAAGRDRRRRSARPSSTTA